ncbi:MAG: hypothetical protein WBI07_18765 [Mobilitalea sp.]
MDKKIKNISQNIRSGKLLEESIPQLFNYLANYYQTNAGIQLSMHYYAFYEAYCDEEDNWSKEIKKVTKQLNAIISNNILLNKNGKDREDAIHAVDSIREDIKSRMDFLTAYTDIFQIYEYVLNRMEYRFKEEMDNTDEEEFEKEVLRYIFESEDNMVINEKLKDIIGQLPVRITKQKYFDILKDSINAYLGADKSALDTYLYILKTSAMIYHKEKMDTCYPELEEKRKSLAGIEYKNITQSTYEEAVKELQIATLILETETSVYFGLCEMVNDIYAILLCTNYAGMVDTGTEDAKKAAFSIIRVINEIFMVDDKWELPMELMDQFTDIEGVQEATIYELTTLEDALYEVEENHKKIAESLMLDQVLQVLLRTQKLLSNSLFIDLEDMREEETVDEEIVAREVLNITNELTELFAVQDRIITRAVMANTLSKMPVFLRNHKEVMDYVCYSIERCSDLSEKTACIDIIKSMMEDDRDSSDF